MNFALAILFRFLGGDMVIRFFTSGAFVNFILVIIGGAVGMLLKRGIPEKIQQTLMNAMALCVLFIGVTGLFEDDINTLIIIISMGVGAVIGQAIDLDGLVNRLALKIESKFNKGSAQSGKIAEGFTTATLLFCVGAMTVVGSIDSGVSGDNSTLYSKSVIDAIAAAIFASSMGFGVVLSSVAVLVVEGALTLMAVAVEPVLTARVVAHMSVIGSLLIIAISLNMLKLTKIKVMNIIPAIFIPLILCLFM